MSRSRRSARRTNGGFSLLELMLVTALLGIFFGAVYEVVIVGLRVVSATDDREELRQQLVSALERFAREASLADDVDDAASGQFRFDTPSMDDVEYTYDSGDDTLSRDERDSAERVVLRRLTSFDFSYLDDDGTQLSEPVASSAEDDIRVVQVSATVSQGGEAITVNDAVFLRNR